MSTQMVRRWCQEFQDGRMSVLDDARPHTTPSIGSASDHAPYSPDLAPGDFHFFPTLNTTFERHRFTTNGDVEAAVRTQDTDFYQQGVLKLVSGGTNASMSVGSRLKISRLTPRSAHIGVYLVHAVSSRWRTRETYFPTVPRIFVCLLHIKLLHEY
jgi:hypothetical protein